MKTVAFIPARKGSKGLPGKNKKNFHGKPLIQWSIDQAKDSKIFDKIIVSSDDSDILSIAKTCNVTYTERDESLATDESRIQDVMYDFFARPLHECDYICLLNPTSPLRVVKDITKTFRFVKMKQYHSVVSVKWCDFIGWVGRPTNKGPICSYNINDRPNRQTRNDFYLENGAIYWCKHDVLMGYGNFIGNPVKVKLYEMPVERSFEIDTPFDWWLAEKVYEYQSMG